MRQGLSVQSGRNPALMKFNKRLSSLETSLYSALQTTRVLVADDDNSTSQLLQSRSVQENYQVVTVCDGREAFRRLRMDANFNVAIFNVKMPNLHSVEIVKYMKSEKRLLRIPIVLVSAEGAFDIVAETFAAGAMAFLPKPFTAQQLLQVLRLVMRGSERRETRRAA